jgi:branched-chain amino acid aminotransferase
MMQTKGAQSPVEDPRNDGILVYVNGRLVPRAEASVSVFDAGFVLGDGIWEGFRLVEGTIVFEKDHLARLASGARAIDIDLSAAPEDPATALRRTMEANGMHDGAHIRLMVTRGVKRTPNQDPRNALGRPTVVVVAEYKVPDPGLKRAGMSLFTSTFRCSGPDVFDLRLNSHSRLNLIQALLQAIRAGAHEALMLDPQGFVASCNSTNFFFVKDGVVRTSTGRFNFKGITRAKVLDLCRREGIACEEGDFTLAEVYDADEVFVTGTFGGVTPVSSVDGRPAGTVGGPVTARLDALYQGLVAHDAARGRAGSAGR